MILVPARSLPAIAIAAAMAAGTPAAAAFDAPPTFSKDVAPILYEACGVCHRAGGSAPFSLLTYDAARQRAGLIADVTTRRFMPPWKADAPPGEFIGQRPLRDAEIATIQQWVKGGAREGNPADLPASPQWTDGWQLGEPDLIVSFPEPYLLRADGTDVFRVFAVPLPLDRARDVIGLEFRPGNPVVVHHANLRLDSTPASRRRDEEDPLPGYDGLLARTAVYPDGHFLGWTPGQVAPLLPASLAWRLEPGTDLVIQLHMQPSGKPEEVQPSIGLYFARNDATAGAAASTSRAAPRVTPVVIRLGDQAIEIPPGRADYTITDSYVLPVDVELQAVQPHAHYRARAIQGAAALPDGSTRRLIHIADWDFRWQHVYRYAAPVPLPKGTTVSMRYTYDNSDGNRRNPQRPPARVRWGQRSNDEMGDLWLQVLTRSERDRAALAREVRVKMAAEDAVGYETMVRENPGDPELRDDVAVLYLELGRAAEAVAHCEASARLKPDSPAAHFNLGTALTVAGRLDEAMAEYRRALAIRPDYAAAHANLGNALLARGDRDRALAHFRAALRADPEQAVAHNSLGHALLEAGDSEGALGHLREALRIDPRYAQAHYNVGRLMSARGDWSAAAGHFRRAVASDPNWAPALAELAWLLAAAPPDALRDADQAVGLALRAVDLTGRRDARVLDVLGAAYAAAGAFDRAAETALEALSLSPPEAAAAVIRERRALYQRKVPYRLPEVPAPPPGGAAPASASASSRSP